jgi:hypothetical protein
MNPSDFIYVQIYRGAIRAGAKEPKAKDNAIAGLEEWKKGKFKKPSMLIEQRIKQAKRESK